MPKVILFECPCRTHHCHLKQSMDQWTHDTSNNMMFPVSVGHDHFHLPSIDRIDRIDLARAAAQVLMFHPGTCRIPRSLELPNI